MWEKTCQHIDRTCWLAWQCVHRLLSPFGVKERRYNASLSVMYNLDSEPSAIWHSSTTNSGKRKNLLVKGSNTHDVHFNKVSKCWLDWAYFMSLRFSLDFTLVRKLRLPVATVCRWRKIHWSPHLPICSGALLVRYYRTRPLQLEPSIKYRAILVKHYKVSLDVTSLPLPTLVYLCFDIVNSATDGY